MNTYKVWIQIEEIDDSKDRYLNIGESYEVAKFNTEIEAKRFVENELLVIRAANAKLTNACRAARKFLKGLGKANLMTMLRKLQACRNKLNDALNQDIPAVNDNCPKCGAGFDERELTGKDFLGIEAIHMHYICKKCGSQITEEFTLTDVFIDDPQN